MRHILHGVVRLTPVTGWHKLLGLVRISGVLGKERMTCETFGSLSD